MKKFVFVGFIDHVQLGAMEKGFNMTPSHYCEKFGIKEETIRLGWLQKEGSAPSHMKARVTIEVKEEGDK